MAKVREQYWVPRLQRHTKKVVKKCHGCKRWNVQAFVVSPPGQLLKDGTEGQSAFKVIRVDFAFGRRRILKERPILRFIPELDEWDLLRSVARLGNQRVFKKPEKIHRLSWPADEH